MARCAGMEAQLRAHADLLSLPAMYRTSTSICKMTYWDILRLLIVCLLSTTPWSKSRAMSSVSLSEWTWCLKELMNIYDKYIWQILVRLCHPRLSLQNGDGVISIEKRPQFRNMIVRMESSMKLLA